MELLYIQEAYAHEFLASGSQSLEIGKAGCELTWAHLFSEPIPRAVHLLGRFDVWDHDDPQVQAFQYGVRQYDDTRPSNDELWDTLLGDYDVSDEIVDATIEVGKTLLKYERGQATKFCKAYAFETVPMSTAVRSLLSMAVAVTRVLLGSNVSYYHLES